MTEYDKVIPPGGVGKVTAQIHTANFKGPIAKSVTVTTNDPAKRTFTLQLKANVLVPIDVQPSEMVSFLGRYDAIAPQVLTVVAADGKPFDIVSVTPKDPTIQAKIVAKPEDGSTPAAKAGTAASGASRYELTVSLPDEPKVGKIASQIDIATTHPKAPTLTVRVHGTVSGDITFAPQTLMLQVGAAATPEQKQGKVLVQKTTGDALKVTGVTCDNPAIKTSFAPVDGGKSYEISVSYDGPPVTGALSAQIKVQTNDKRQPVVEIPIFGRADAVPGMAGNTRPQNAMPLTPGQPISVKPPGAVPVDVRPAPPAPAPKP